MCTEDIKESVGLETRYLELNLLAQVGIVFLIVPYGRSNGCLGVTQAKKNSKICIFRKSINRFVLKFRFFKIRLKNSTGNAGPLSYYLINLFAYINMLVIAGQTAEQID